MIDDFFQTPLDEVKRDLRCGIIECQKRGLVHSTKWLAEMSFSLADVDIDSEDAQKREPGFQVTRIWKTGIAPKESDQYYMAKSYFDIKEFDRAAYFVRNCESEVPRFLYWYSTYMAREKRRQDTMTDQTNVNDSLYIREQTELLNSLRTEYTSGRLDGYGLYLYGVLLKRLNLTEHAIQIFLQATHMAPMLWNIYLELAPLIKDGSRLMALNVTRHWMRYFFHAHNFLEMYLNDEAIRVYGELKAIGFRNSIYITSQLALAYHNKRDVAKAIESFQELQENDPYRLETLDTYSNLLFVKEMKTEMSQLAHKAVSIDKYRSETCCIIGNYYSIRCDHQMAIMYFQRALRLNPNYLAAWTLMGHEFMEVRNTNAAIQSYRKAVEVNSRDYRAWYGLGQSYEILKMHYYSLYYFKVAHKLRPFDSRMLVALGETYEKLDRIKNAIKCYSKACNVGDIEGIAMYKLANLYERMGNYEDAIHCYAMYCEDENAATDKQSLYHGYITLANYYEHKGDLNRASHYAYKCLQSDDLFLQRKAEAKALLKTIENRRRVVSEATQTYRPADDTTSALAVSVAGQTADTSSEDDDMDIEMGQDFKYDCIEDYRTRRQMAETDEEEPEEQFEGGSSNDPAQQHYVCDEIILAEDLIEDDDVDDATPSTSAAALRAAAARAATESRASAVAAAAAIRRTIIPSRSTTTLTTTTLSSGIQRPGGLSSRSTTARATDAIDDDRENDEVDEEEASFDSADASMEISSISMD